MHRFVLFIGAHFFIFFIFFIFFTACSTKYQNVKEGPVDHQVERENDGNHQAVRFREEVDRFHQKVRSRWGYDAEVSGRNTYVKYSNSFKSRASVNFETRKIIVETTDETNPDESLKNAIVATLLTPKDPTKVELYSEKDTEFYGEPFLFEEVLDNEGQSIRWPWRANRFAEYLLETKKEKKSITTKGGVKKNVYYVTFDMIGTGKPDDVIVANAMGKKYKSYVMKQAKRYNLDPSLIFAIMESESHFNPYAVSSIPAFGLMQVVPSSAGKDAWDYLEKGDGRPSKSYLFDPENNIEIGSTYLHILNTQYLKEIKDPRSREHCIIAAYNTGSGNVLKVFSKDRAQAIKVINRLTPSGVFNWLKKSLPYDETKRYVVKVTNAKKRYSSI